MRRSKTRQSFTFYSATTRTASGKPATQKWMMFRGQLRACCGLLLRIRYNIPYVSFDHCPSCLTLVIATYTATKQIRSDSEIRRSMIDSAYVLASLQPCSSLAHAPRVQSLLNLRRLYLAKMADPYSFQHLQSVRNFSSSFSVVTIVPESE